MLDSVTPTDVYMHRWNYVNIDLDNGLSPEQCQASIQSRAETSITFQNI